MKRIWIVFNKAGDAVYSGDDVVAAGVQADKHPAGVLMSYVPEADGELPNKLRFVNGQAVEVAKVAPEPKSAKK
jgi:hypothetical protein